MKYIPKKNAVRWENSPSCIAIEHPHEDPDLNIAVVTIKGRYPDSGSVVNDTCKEIGYVIDGQIKVTVDGVTKKLFKSDSILINAGETISWDGDATLLMSCSPAWSEQQHRHVEES